jgi:outer membrane protein assembly factor BamB
MRLAGLILVNLHAGCQEYTFEKNQVEDPGIPDIDSVDLGPPAKAPVYANTSSELFEVDPGFDLLELVGGFSLDGQAVEHFVDLAVDLDGRMYGGTYDSLYEIGPTNAELRFHCATQANMTAMTFGADGVLYVGGGSTIVALDLADCSSELVLESADYETSGDLVGSPDGALYWTVKGENGDELVRFDPATGDVEWLQVLIAERLYGVGYDDGELLGFSSFGKIVSVPLDGGESTVIANSAEAWWGAATNPLEW